MTNQPNTTIHPILAVPWIEAGEPATVPTLPAPAPATPEPAAPEPRRREMPMLHALVLASIAALAVVSLAAAGLAWFSPAVLFGMFTGELVAAGIVAAAWPHQHTNSAETFHTWSSEPREPFVYPPCSPTRHTITGRGDHVA